MKEAHQQWQWRQQWQWQRQQQAAFFSFSYSHALRACPAAMFECDSVESSVQLHKVEAANKQCMDIKDGDDCEDEDG